jgi:hypothetical protein
MQIDMNKVGNLESDGFKRFSLHLKFFIRIQVRELSDQFWQRLLLS